MESQTQTLPQKSVNSESLFWVFIKAVYQGPKVNPYLQKLQVHKLDREMP